MYHSRGWTLMHLFIPWIVWQGVAMKSLQLFKHYDSKVVSNTTSTSTDIKNTYHYDNHQSTVPLISSYSSSSNLNHLPDSNNSQGASSPQDPSVVSGDGKGKREAFGRDCSKILSSLSLHAQVINVSKHSLTLEWIFLSPSLPESDESATHTSPTFQKFTRLCNLDGRNNSILIEASEMSKAGGLPRTNESLATKFFRVGQLFPNYPTTNYINNTNLVPDGDKNLSNGISLHRNNTLITGLHSRVILYEATQLRPSTRYLVCLYILPVVHHVPPPKTRIFNSPDYSNNNYKNHKDHGGEQILIPPSLNKCIVVRTEEDAIKSTERYINIGSSFGAIICLIVIFVVFCRFKCKTGKNFGGKGRCCFGDHKGCDGKHFNVPLFKSGDHEHNNHHVWVQNMWDETDMDANRYPRTHIPMADIRTPGGAFNTLIRIPSQRVANRLRTFSRKAPTRTSSLGDLPAMYGRYRKNDDGDRRLTNVTTMPHDDDNDDQGADDTEDFVNVAVTRGRSSYQSARGSESELLHPVPRSGHSRNYMEEGLGMQVDLSNSTPASSHVLPLADDESSSDEGGEECYYSEGIID